MPNVSSFLSSTSPKAIMQGQPGSNGYWRRDIYRLPGTYTWTAPKSGRIKIQAIGTASGGSGQFPGASGAYGDKTLSVNKGDMLTLVLGTGGAGSAGSATSGNGSSTSISGAPIGPTPLTLIGATGVNSTNLATGAPGSATGPWDQSFPGNKGSAAGQGSPSSGSPFGAGKKSTGGGGAGWAIENIGEGGAGSHTPSVGQKGGGGLISAGGQSGSEVAQAMPSGTPVEGAAGDSAPFWDLDSVDSGGGGAGRSGSGSGGAGGPGAGGGAFAGSNAYYVGGLSVLGGGAGYSYGKPAKSGYGAAGGASVNSTGGDGGNAIIFIFWDEVA